MGPARWQKQRRSPPAAAGASRRPGLAPAADALYLCVAVSTASAALVALALLLQAPPPPRIGATGSPESRSGILRDVVRSADGSYVYRNRRAGFTGTIHPDGTVTFKDHVVSSPRVWHPFGIDLSGGTPNVPDPTLPSNTLVRPSDLASLGDDPLVKSGPYGAPPILIGVGGRMAGVSDLAHATRFAGAKQRFLDATAELRGQLARDHRRANERAALASLHGDLQRIWDAAQTPVTLRREQLFQRWDECDEEAAGEQVSAEDRARGHAGAIARQRIEAWIREHVPQRGADAFTAAELRDMNQRKRSRARFDPYAAPAAATTTTAPATTTTPPAATMPASPPTD